MNNYFESMRVAAIKGTTGIVAAISADSPDFLAAVPDAFRDPVKLLAMAVSAAPIYRQVGPNGVSRPREGPKVMIAPMSWLRV